MVFKKNLVLYMDSAEKKERKDSEKPYR